MKTIIIAAILLLATSVHAVSVMDFDVPPFPSGDHFPEFLHSTYTENGIRMQNTAGHYDLRELTPCCNFLVEVDIGSLDQFTPNGPISTVRFDRFGGLFNLLSIDVIEALGIGSLTSSVGGLLTFPTSVGIHTFSDSTWTNLQWVDFTSTGGFIGLDNFTIQAVPEPSTLTLLGFGVVALAGWRSKRRTERRVNDKISSARH